MSGEDTVGSGAGVSQGVAGDAEAGLSDIQRVVQWLIVLALVYALMIAVGLLSQGFRSVSGGAAGATAIFEFATNPIVGVLLGVLATSISFGPSRGRSSMRCVT